MKTTLSVVGDSQCQGVTELGGTIGQYIAAAGCAC